MADEIKVPVEIGGPAAVADVNRLIKAVDGLERAVDKLGPKVDKADDAVKKAGDSAEKTASKWERFRTALGGDIVQPESIAGMAAAYNHLTTAAQSAVAAVQAVVHAAGEAEQTQRALTGLGATYDAIQQATAGTVTAQQAFAAQQRLVRSGLRISGEEMTRTARYARDFARATGQETPEALERLTDALIGGSADELMEFGIRATEGASRARILNDAFADMARQQRGQAVASRTLSEDTARLGSAFSEAASSMALLASNGLGLQGVISSIGTAVRGLATDLQDVIRIQREAEAGAANRARRQRATETFRAAQDEARQAFLERGGRIEDFRRALPPADTINRLNTEQLERAAASLRGRFAGTRSTTAIQGVLAGAERERRQGRRFGAVDPNATPDAARLFGVDRDLGARRPFDRAEREGILADLGGVIREMTGNVAANSRPARTAPRDRLNSGVDVATPATAGEIRSARAALALALLQRAAADAQAEIGVEGRAVAFGVSRDVGGEFAREARATRLDAARAGMDETGARTGENEAARINRIAQATTAYAEALREQTEADRAAATAAEASALALKDREEAIGTQLRAAAQQDFATRIDATTRAYAGLTAQLGEVGPVAEALGIADDRRVVILREQVTAMQSLAQEARNRIELLRLQGAAESELAAARQQALTLDAAQAQSSRELVALERERSAATRAWADGMVSSLGSVATAFGAATVAALDGEEGFARALQGQLRSAMFAIAQESVVQVLKNSALSAASFAMANVPSGVAHLKAAGLWAAAGVAAGAIGVSIPKVEKAPTGGASSSRPPAPARAREGSAGEASAGPLVLNFTINGAMMNEGIEDSIIRAIDRADSRGYRPRSILSAARGMS